MIIQKYKVKLDAPTDSNSKFVGAPVFKENGSDVIIGFVSAFDGTEATITLFEPIDLPIENKNITVSSRVLSDEDMFKDFES